MITDADWAAAAPAPVLPARHIHLPSVHVRTGANGFDYDEDLYVRRRKGECRVTRQIQLTVTQHGRVLIQSVKTDVLCPDELRDLVESLPFLTTTDLLTGELVDPEAAAEMEKRARYELARQFRIAAGEEHACVGCGCSESRACSGGCLWARPNLCSRCV